MPLATFISETDGSKWQHDISFAPRESDIVQRVNDYNILDARLTERFYYVVNRVEHMLIDTIPAGKITPISKQYMLVVYLTFSGAVPGSET